MVARKKNIEPVKIVCFGDSITHAAAFAEADRWPTILQFKFEQAQPGVFRVYNLGIGGNTSAQGLDRFSQVDQLLPGIVLIEFGFNDANVREPSSKARVSIPEFKLNLREFALMIARRGGQAVFMVNHTIGPQRAAKPDQGNGKSYAANFTPYNPAIRAVAKQCACPLIDLPEIMKKRRVQLPEFLADDGLHLTAAGNHVFADMVFSRLQEILDKNK